MIYILRIHLKDLDTPKVWRQIAVPSTLTFNQLHEIIQIVFGWSDYHLYEFTDRPDMLQEGSYRISISCADDADYHDVKTTDARKTKISKILSKSDDLKYIYDFGDYWEFEIHIIDRKGNNRCATLPRRRRSNTPRRLRRHLWLRANA
jgi:hypothetical protein